MHALLFVRACFCAYRTQLRRPWMAILDRLPSGMAILGHYAGGATDAPTWRRTPKTSAVRHQSLANPSVKLRILTDCIVTPNGESRPRGPRLEPRRLAELQFSVHSCRRGARHLRSIRRCSSTAAPRRSGRGPVPSPPASSSPRRSGGRPYRRARSTTWSRQDSARTGVPMRAS